MENAQNTTANEEINYGNVYIMTHSIFSDVIKIGCTVCDTEEYAKSLSAKGPGHYKIFFSLACNNPYTIQNKLKTYFTNKQYINEFYDVAPETAKNLLQREALRIPILSLH